TMARECAYGLRYRSSAHRARRFATLAALLQRAQTAQLARRPTPNQPRSQRPWAGQLGLRTHRSCADPAAVSLVAICAFAFSLTPAQIRPVTPRLRVPRASTAASESVTSE